MALKKSEHEVQHEIVEVLRRLGWVVRTFNLPHRAKSGTVGWYDVIAIKHNSVLFIEVKAGGKRGVVRESQKKLHDQVQPHTGPNVAQIVADDWSQVEVLMNGMSELREGCL